MNKRKSVRTKRQKRVAPEAGKDFGTPELRPSLSSANILDLLFAKELIDRDQYNAGLRYGKICFAAKRAIDAPCLARALLEEKRGVSVSEARYEAIERRWYKVQQVLRDLGTEVLQVIENVVIYDRMAIDAAQLRLLDLGLTHLNDYFYKANDRNKRAKRSQARSSKSKSAAG